MRKSAASRAKVLQKRLPRAHRLAARCSHATAPPSATVSRSRWQRCASSTAFRPARPRWPSSSPGQRCGPHRRVVVRLREHGAHSFQTNLRQAGHPQAPRTHRPRGALRARGTVRAEAILNAVSAESPGAASVRPLLPFQQLLHGTAQGAGQAVEGYALGLVDVLLPLLV